MNSDIVYTSNMTIEMKKKNELCLPPPRLTVAQFATLKQFSLPLSPLIFCTTTTTTSTTSAITTAAAATTTSKTRLTIPTTGSLVSQCVDNEKKISQIIATLQDTHLNFNKIKWLHKKRLDQLKKQLHRKNKIIVQLETSLKNQQERQQCVLNKNNKPSKPSRRYFGVVRAGNVIRTIVGREVFVRRRIAELCLHLSEAEKLWCHVSDGKEREHIASLFAANADTRQAIVYEKNRRFEFLTRENTATAIQLILDYLKDKKYEF